MANDKKRVSVSISLTDAEKEALTAAARNYGLSLSAFLRLAAREYVSGRVVIEAAEDKSE